MITKKVFCIQPEGMDEVVTSSFELAINFLLENKVLTEETYIKENYEDMGLSILGDIPDWKSWLYSLDEYSFWDHVGSVNDIVLKSATFYNDTKGGAE